MRVLIIDAYPLFREAIALQVAKVVEHSCIFEVSSCEEALALQKLYSRFDLVICCINRYDYDLHWFSRWKQEALEVKILLMLDDSTAMLELLQKKEIDGFLAKSADLHEVKQALKLVLMGECYISPSLLMPPQQPLPVAKPKYTNKSIRHFLTPRQLQVLHLIAAGFSNKDIANQLSCSDGTIKLHVSAIFKEFKVANRIGAIKYATKLGLLSND